MATEVLPDLGTHFHEPVSWHVWDAKYRYREGNVVRDQTIEDTWRRVARALAAAEPESERARWAERFYQVLYGFKFLPGGRILAGAGTRHRVTLFNCFVMGIIEDSLDGIFDSLKEGALTMQQGGGVGYDFSTLRPAGTRARTTGTIASGPVSFMHIWDAMCATLLSTGARRGAMMATLRCDHPDIETFVTAKHRPGVLTHFNLSVQVFDEFMEAVRRDADWPLVFPAAALEDEGMGDGPIVYRRWTGTDGPVPCRVLRVVKARALWEQILRATYDYAEPGVLFIDTINRMNNLAYREHITATNPCGEQPLPPYGACDLGSINLTRFVRAPFTPEADLDWEGIRETVAVAVRMLDNVIDVSGFPLPAQAEQARGTRRIGLGITGLADALIMLGLHYASEEARQLAARVMQTICHTAYRTSIALAREKGVFPFFERERYLESPFIQALPEDIRKGIATYGIRNSHLLSIAPTGTISLLANNVSSGIEPVFAYRYTRYILGLDGERRAYTLTDYALRLWQRLHGDSEMLPEAFVDAQHLDPYDHLKMQAALQPYVDGAISKTVNVPADTPFNAFRQLYDWAYDHGLKGCTTYRPSPVRGAVLEAITAGVAESTHCCSIEREAD
ncbi:adenosylcobalamin-dependent ribonucleoside-diphosphate reductase [Rhodothermus marinus]|uniref:Vitamin B12-dependent ribonucleotide reductase n=1 Tax=Rhodothermus marinus (strain ATCC 43812 / DSM 4252 / R-10) TaxID=518766 RepID=D0ME23_RHOM4|nr:adenosylcobalamin-dependent ribonucleoside-diphosphate reductase [Rhodothermus marinus]ACY47247.1 ribonucleoside-diphosphate reductase, adenosylcobalamin-dependent [Rhodothermus marinus DSM 4252]